MSSEEREPYLPTGYRLDESDPEVVILRRANGSEVSAFSAEGATREAIEAVAWKDHDERKER